MLSSQTHPDQLPRHDKHISPDNSHDDADGPEKTTRLDTSSINTGIRVECLDGLRGIACISVFTYHFFWPWTQAIMLGNGFWAPLSAEPYMNWLSLPLICLLHRGRAMVAIFFAISGYVLCRNMVKSIHDRNWDAVYRSISSSVFRRVFRLYIPPTISMFIVALLAQAGTFQLESDVYTGAASAYINGSLIMAHSANYCAADSVPVSGPPEIAELIGLRSAEYLGNTSNLAGELCLSRYSVPLSPFTLYGFVKRLETEAPKEGLDLADTSHNIYREMGLSIPSPTDSRWVQYGGTWEEHPIIHQNLFQALQNFFRVYVEWANPFTFTPIHTRYDPHTYTMPIELRGSMVIYIFLLGTLGLKPLWRLLLGGAISMYSLAMSRWEMATFLGAAMLSDMDVWISHGSGPVYRSADHIPKQLLLSPRAPKIIRWVVFFFALYLLSYPDVGPEHTPGFMFLSRFVPQYYLPLGGWQFYQSLGAMLLIPCIVRSRLLCELLESPLAQYLGKMSFSIYLIHGPVLRSLGLRVMPMLFDRFGRTGGYLIGWTSLLTITMSLSHWWYKKVDVWSTTVGKRIERLLADS